MLQYVNFYDASSGRFPVGHTCGNSLEFHVFGEKEAMKKRLLIAIRLCGEIDDDGDYLDDSDYQENDENIIRSMQQTTLNQ